MRLRELWGIPIPGTEKAVGLLPALRMLSDWANEAYPEMEFEECRIIENVKKTSVQQRI